MTQLVQWHNCRVRLLESIISQKMGLYHHSKLKDWRKEMVCMITLIMYYISFKFLTGKQLLES